MRKFDFMYYSYMLSLNIQVPVPKKISDYKQIILPFQKEVWLSLGIFILSTSIYNLVLLYVCHFHHHHPTFWQFIDYRDTHAFILDPCIQEFSLKIESQAAGII